MNPILARSGLIAAVLALPAGAADAGNSDPADRPTAWTQPSTVESPGTCSWRAEIVPYIPDDNTDDPPYVRTTMQARDAYAHTIARGQQIWGYAWAADAGVGAGAAAISSASCGAVRVYAETIPGGCIPSMQLDWKPRFRVRVHQKDPPGYAVAGGLMDGHCSALGVGVRLAHTEAVRSDADVYRIEVGATVMGVNGNVNVPFQLSTSTAPKEQTLQAYLSATAHISDATATYVGAVWMEAFADSDIFNWYAKSEAWVWDSMPGLDLHGECLNPCSGYAYGIYGWQN